MPGAASLLCDDGPVAEGRARKRSETTGVPASGGSQVGTTGAMRARDAARPREKDLLRAERSLVIRRQRDESSSAS